MKRGFKWILDIVADESESDGMSGIKLVFRSHGWKEAKTESHVAEERPSGERRRRWGTCSEFSLVRNLRCVTAGYLSRLSGSVVQRRNKEGSSSVSMRHFSLTTLTTT